MTTNPTNTTSTSTSTSQTTGSGVSTTPAETSDGGGGEASADLTAWAGGVCEAMAPAYEAITDMDASPGSDPAAMLTAMQENMSALGPAFHDAADKVSDLGAAPIDNGDELTSQLSDLMHTTGDAFADAAEKLADVDPSDPNAMTALQDAMTSFSTEVQESSQKLGETFESDDLTAAFEAAPACAALS